METIKIIEDEVKRIVEDNKDFTELVESVNNEINSFNEKREKIKKNIRKLFNFIFSKSNRKILFEYFGRKIGINKSGLGIIRGYEKNLSNINDFWAGKDFTKLLTELTFCNNFLDSIDDKKKKEIVKKVLIDNFSTRQNFPKEDTIIEKEDLDVGIKIRSNGKLLFYHIKTEETLDYIIDAVKTYEDNCLIEISKTNYQNNYHDLMEFIFLVNRKEKLKPILEKELINYKKLNEDADKEIKIIDAELSPYVALQQI